MAATDQLILGSINYYCQAKYYRHLQNVCLEGLRKHGNDPVLMFWKAFGILMEDRVSEGIREFEAIQDREEVVLCSLMALIYAHKKAKMIDKESVQQLEARLKQTRTSCGENALYFAAMFLWHAGRHDKAREYVDRMLKMAPDSKEAAILRGWIDLTCGRDSATKKSIKFFDEALQGSSTSQNIDALFGKAKYLVKKNNFSLALEMINQVVVSYPTFEPALIEKMNIQLALQDWEQTMDVAQRCLSLNRYSLEVHKMKIMFLLCRDGKYDEASDGIGELIQLFDRHEPKSHHLYYEAGQLFSRVCGNNMSVLQQTFELVARAQSLSETTAEYATELGNQLVMQKKVRDAMKSYRTAMKLDETSVPALTGIIKCQLLENMIDDAEQQLEFLNEIQQSIGKSAELSYLGAVLARKKEKRFEEVIALLNESTDTHFKDLQGVPLGLEYFLRLNPTFLLEVTEEYLIFAPNEPQISGQPVSPMLKRCAAVLDPLTKATPGLLQGLYLMTKVRYLSGDIETAKTMLNHCLEKHDRFSDGHILMAQIHLREGNYRMADQSLEVGLSYNFEVRESPLYHLIKAWVQKNLGNHEECIKILNTAMGLPGVRKAIPVGQGGKKANSISLSDRVSVYLELATSHSQLNHTHEAAKIMQDAMNEFAGTSEEVRVSIANADLFLKRGDFKEALAILRSVTPEQSYFIQAREKMADIYLHHRKDKILYASCYRELVEIHPSPHTSLLLGDAYMSIQEPEQAIEVYEAALKRNPRDSTLASKIGQALIRTHNYNKAINYYEAAVKSGNQGFLRYDLAELYMKMKNYEKAEKVIRAAMEQQKGTELASLIEESKLLVLLSKIQQRLNNIEEYFKVLTQARDVQIRVLKRVGVEQPDQVPTQRLVAAKICCDLAEIATSKRDYDQAINSYKEALSYDSSHTKAMLALAKLHLLVNDVDACQQQCTHLLKMDKDNDDAFMMMAELMFRKHDYESAMFHFQQLLERKPDQYEALGRLLDLLRRAGKLEECDKFLEQAERSPRAGRDAGLNYCKGMNEWYKNNPTQALKYFNLARKDSKWGERATYNMIEICLNPDNETLGGETFEGVDTDLSNQAEKKDSQMAAVKTAEKLLKEIKPKGALKHRILENYALMANKNKSTIEKSLSDFMEIATAERDHIPSLLGMATAYMYLKQTPRARNQLKRIAKMNWRMEEAEEFERSWLLLADVYIQSGKYDMAGDLLKKCLDQNKSCCKAWEYLGFIMEKEQAYKDAAKNYENAWKFGNQNNPAIGYKLAFNYLKAKRFADAIDVCHQVLSQHPKYPRIKREILEKARSSIRT